MRHCRFGFVQKNIFSFQSLTGKLFFPPVGRWNVRTFLLLQQYILFELHRWKISSHIYSFFSVSIFSPCELHALVVIKGFSFSTTKTVKNFALPFKINFFFRELQTSSLKHIVYESMNTKRKKNFFFTVVMKKQKKE